MYFFQGEGLRVFTEVNYDVSKTQGAAHHPCNESGDYLLSVGITQINRLVHFVHKYVCLRLVMLYILEQQDMTANGECVL